MEDLCFRYKQEKNWIAVVSPIILKACPRPFLPYKPIKRGTSGTNTDAKKAFAAERKERKGNAPSSLLKWKLSPDSAMTKPEDSRLLLKPPNSDSAQEWHKLRNCKLSVATHLFFCETVRYGSPNVRGCSSSNLAALHVTSKAVRTNYVRRACLIRRWIKRRLESLPLVMCCAASNRALYSVLLNDLQMSQMWNDWITALTDKLPWNQQQHDQTAEF